MSTTQDTRALELSRVLLLSELDDREVVRDIVATAEERAAIACRLGVEELTALEAEVRVGPGPIKGSVLVSGTLRADLVQTCVVILVPVDNRVEMSFETAYARPEVVADWPIDDDEAPGPPEAIIDEQIDLGEEVVQQLACAIDPYPRAPGAEVDERWVGAVNDGSVAGPFAALARLRQKH